MDLATKRPGLAGWADSWVERIAELYRLNRQRLEHWDAERSLEEQDPAFQRVQQQLTAALRGLFRQTGEELEALPAPRGKGRGRKPSADLQRAPLQSLLRHREGLETFLTEPFCPLDNNPAERALRGAAIGRKLSFGSFSERGAALAGCLYSVYATLRLAGINPWLWTQAYLQACAEAGGKPPPDARRWLPWGLPPERVADWQSGLSPPAQGPALSAAGSTGASPTARSSS